MVLNKKSKFSKRKIKTKRTKRTKRTKKIKRKIKRTKRKIKRTKRKKRNIKAMMKKLSSDEPEPEPEPESILGILKRFLEYLEPASKEDIKMWREWVDGNYEKEQLDQLGIYAEKYHACNLIEEQIYDMGEGFFEKWKNFHESLHVETPTPPLSRDTVDDKESYYCDGCAKKNGMDNKSIIETSKERFKRFKELFRYFKFSNPKAPEKKIPYFDKSPEGKINVSAFFLKHN